MSPKLPAFSNVQTIHLYLSSFCSSYLPEKDLKTDSVDRTWVHLYPPTCEKAREFKKNIYFCFIDYAKAFDCVDHNKLWKILKEMGTPYHLTCLLRNLYAG